jgi:hypothetical protein
MPRDRNRRAVRAPRSYLSGHVRHIDTPYRQRGTDGVPQHPDPSVSVGPGRPLRPRRAPACSKSSTACWGSSTMRVVPPPITAGEARHSSGAEASLDQVAAPDWRRGRRSGLWDGQRSDARTAIAMTTTVTHSDTPGRSSTAEPHGPNEARRLGSPPPCRTMSPWPTTSSLRIAYANWSAAKQI